MSADVAALYIDPRGPYPSLVRECYDEARDAKTYADARTLHKAVPRVRAPASRRMDA